MTGWCGERGTRTYPLLSLIIHSFIIFRITLLPNLQPL
jgi:hypothetical protein